MTNSAFGRFLSKYGQSVEVHYQDEPVGVPCRAVVQPVQEQRRDWLGDLPTPLGRVNRDRWLYLGDPGVPLEDMEEGYLLWEGRALRVVNAQAVYIGSELSHWWAVLRQREGE